MYFYECEITSFALKISFFSSFLSFHARVTFSVRVRNEKKDDEKLSERKI